MKGVIVHDGVHFQLDELVKLAKNAGSYVLAMPYMMSILYYAARTEQPELAEVCNAIRAHYNLSAFSASPPASVQNLPAGTTAADVARRRYRALPVDGRRDVLRVSLAELQTRRGDLFTSKECWIGVYLVVHDRLDDKLRKKAFYDLAVAATPEEWPEQLAIGPSTMSNYARHIPGEVRLEAYYDMGDSCPWQLLCECFWEILQKVLLTWQ